MISEFISSITVIQLSVVIFLIVYLLIYGVKYHLLAIYGYLSGRGISNDWIGISLNWLGYIAIACCLYWFI